MAKNNKKRKVRVAKQSIEAAAARPSKTASKPEHPIRTDLNILQAKIEGDQVDLQKESANPHQSAASITTCRVITLTLKRPAPALQHSNRMRTISTDSIQKDLNQLPANDIHSTQLTI